MAWLGLWHGGSSYAAPYVADDLEVFGSLVLASDALRARYADGYGWRQSFEYVSRPAEHVFCPAVGGDSTMWLWRVPTGVAPVDFAATLAADPDPYPHRVMSIGPRGGVAVAYA